jgi:DNA-directed RNA polymerase specialized sigma subunit, sigma24 homolog
MDRQLVIKVYIDNITPLRAYAYSIVHNEEDANDIVQELAVRIIRAMDAGMEIKYPKTFLFRCTRNLSIDAGV